MNYKIKADWFDCRVGIRRRKLDLDILFENPGSVIIVSDLITTFGLSSSSRGFQFVVNLVV